MADDTELIFRVRLLLLLIPITRMCHHTVPESTAKSFSHTNYESNSTNAMRSLVAYASRAIDVTPLASNGYSVVALAHMKRKQKMRETMRTMGVIVVTYLLCNGPSFVLTVVEQLTPQLLSLDETHGIPLWYEWWADINSALFMFCSFLRLTIYLACNAELRAYFLLMLKAEHRKEWASVRRGGGGLPQQTEGDVSLLECQPGNKQYNISVKPNTANMVDHRDAHVMMSETLNYDDSYEPTDPV